MRSTACSIAAIQIDFTCDFSTGTVTYKQTILDDVPSLSGNTIIIKTMSC